MTVQARHEGFGTFYEAVSFRVSPDSGEMGDLMTMFAV